MVKRFLRKNKVEDDLAHITFVAKIRTLYFWNRNRQIDQENREPKSKLTCYVKTRCMTEETVCQGVKE